MLLYKDTVKSILTTSIIFNNIDNKNDIVNRIINKQLLFLKKLENYKYSTHSELYKKKKNLLNTIVVYIEILDFIKNDMLSLPELNYKKSNGIDKKNENIFILFYLETSSQCIKTIIFLLEKLINIDTSIKKKIDHLKDLFLKEINPLHSCLDNEINLLLSKDNTKLECFNNLKKESYLKTLNLVEKFIELILG